MGLVDQDGVVPLGLGPPVGGEQRADQPFLVGLERLVAATPQARLPARPGVERADFDVAEAGVASDLGVEIGRQRAVVAENQDALARILSGDQLRPRQQEDRLA